MSRQLRRGFGIVAKGVVRDRSIPGPARLLYAVLASYANDEGECIPGIPTLAEDLGASQRAVRGWMQTLVDRGIVVREPRFTEGRQTSSRTVLRDASAGGEEHTFPPGEEHSRRGEGEHTFPQNNTSRNNTSRKGEARGSQAPSSLPISERMAGWASEKLKITSLEWLASETEDFLDWHRSRGTVMKDWEAGWRTWIRKAVKIAGERRQPEGGDLEQEVREWLRVHPCPVPEALAALEADDPAGFNEAMRPIRAAHRAAAEAELRQQRSLR